MAPLLHGHTRRLGKKSRTVTPEYRAWASMKNRCLNKKQRRYKDYGGRGIKICDRWLHGENGEPGFLCFLWDVGERPGPGYSLDRYPDNDGDYRRGNVRWATKGQQNRNTRATILVDVCGIELPLIDAAARWSRVAYQTVKMRMHRGWDADNALFVPLGGKPGDTDREIPF